MTTEKEKKLTEIDDGVGRLLPVVAVAVEARFAMLHHAVARVAEVPVFAGLEVAEVIVETAAVMGKAERC
jgi:hypothetical protein